MKAFFSVLMIILSVPLFGTDVKKEIGDMARETHPKYLYKIISVENWQLSQGRPSIQLSSEDEEFIHLALEDQLEGIIQKYWSHASSYVVLKVDVAKLRGSLKLEVNPGGANLYYHLYEGGIPMEAVVEAKECL